MSTPPSSDLLGSFGSFDGSDLFGGFTGFGFDVPQGDARQVAAAAAGWHRLGDAIDSQGHAIGAAAGAALAGGGWRGSAADACAAYAEHVARTCSSNASACRTAARVLSGLALALAQAQTVTRQARADCQRAQGELTTQEGQATAAAEDVRIASAIASAVAYPAGAEFARQASDAQEREAAARAAAAAAEDELLSAKRRGSAAFEAYLHDARTAAARLQSAADEIRVAPALPGRGLVPISVSPGDAALAAALAARRPASAGFPEPAELERMAGGPVGPGAVLRFATDFAAKQRLARLAAADRLDGSLTGVIPGPVGRFAGGAWDVAKGDAELLWTAGEAVYHGHPDQVGASIAGYVSWVWHDPVAAIKQSIDWSDWSHGRVSRALGEVGVGLLTSKGAWELGTGGVRAGLAHPGLRPGVTKAAGKAADAFGVPHAGEITDAVAPYTQYTASAIASGVRELPHHALLSMAPLFSTYRIQPVIAQALSELYGLPITTLVQAPARVTYRPAAPVVRAVPRAR